MLFNSSPQRVENDVINRKLDSYNMVSVVVRICTVQGFLWYLQADYPSLTMFCHASTQRIDNCSGVHRWLHAFIEKLLICRGRFLAKISEEARVTLSSN